MNKNGEVLLGIKIETPMAAENSEKTTRIPGIGFAEWGPGDQSFFLLDPPTGSGRGGGDGESHPAMKKVRERIFKASKAASLFFLNACNGGVMICTGGDTPVAEKGRQFTNGRAPGKAADCSGSVSKCP